MDVRNKMSKSELGIDLKVHSYLIVFLLIHFKQCFYSQH